MSSDPQALLGELAALRLSARRDRHAYWLPLLLFGALALAATPLYTDSIGPDGLRAGLGGPALAALGGDLLDHATALGWFWLGALIGGYLISLWWYRRHARQVGLQTPTRLYLRTGVLGVLAGLALGPVLMWLLRNSWTPVSEVAQVVLRPVASLLWLGLMPLVVVGAGLLVLARLERSRFLAGTAFILLVALALAPVYVNAVDFGATFPRWGFLPVVLVPAVILVAAGGAAYLRTARPAR